MRLLSEYAAFHVLMVRCSTESAIERSMEGSLWKKSKLRTIPAQSACMAIAERHGLLELRGSAGRGGGWKTNGFSFITTGLD